jgi:hypothetical protein
MVHLKGRPTKNKAHLANTLRRGGSRVLVKISVGVKSPLCVNRSDIVKLVVLGSKSVVGRGKHPEISSILLTFGYTLSLLPLAEKVVSPPVVREPCDV